MARLRTRVSSFGSVLALTLVVLSSAVMPSLARAEQGSSLFGLIGDDTSPTTLANEYAAGVRAKVVRLSWKDYLPEEATPSASYISAKRAQLAQLRDAGMGVLLDLGLQDTPSWLHRTTPTAITSTSLASATRARAARPG